MLTKTQSVWSFVVIVWQDGWVGKFAIVVQVLSVISGLVVTIKVHNILPVLLFTLVGFVVAFAILVMATIADSTKQDWDAP